MKVFQKDFTKILSSGILTQGKYVKKFEKKIAQFVGTKYAFATTSATTALHLSLIACGIKKGDEVLVSDFTFPATANVVVQIGAKPILIDINPVDLTIDINDLKKKITKKTRAVIPVDTFGYPANMHEIISIAKKNNLKVIEDAACAIGAHIKGKKCGTFQICGCFSFHPRKSMTTGEGGMVTTNDAELARQMQILRNHGGKFDEKKGFYSYVAAGFNYRMSELQASLGIRQIPALKETIRERRKIASYYNSVLSPIPYVQVPREANGRFHTFQSYVLLLDKKIDRNLVIKQMKRKGIETTLGTYALHAEPFFKKNYQYHAGQLPHSYFAYKQSLTLPLYKGLTKKQLVYISNTLTTILKRLYEK